ncbi:MAG TPA: acetyl-CoA carboxylase biotin carboxylase subunit [Fibrobacteraceae bacterium]|nr:acetyl-CoA carboxylase biotin carboxylase subunit [Fibrobacteraceae bacterium]
MFQRILIANRGEIAVRVIRACHELGIEAVAVYSDADRDALHVHMADHAVCIGPAQAAQSYLVQNQILAAALQTKSEAIHPGFGFLSENAEFARICEEIGIQFIGPSAEAIRKLGHKTTAKQLMKENGVPVVPGPAGAFRDPTEALEASRSIGFPLILKAASGGGGRGIRVAQKLEDFMPLFLEASQEAKNAFGDPDMYIEKFLVHPKHIEFQLIADQHGHCVSLGERDCSSQRRKQKIVEESPSPVIRPEERSRMGEILSLAFLKVGYHNAGTVEFLYENGEFYFMEVNTRIQVEHPVTEMVNGIDLIREQIRVAAGEPLSFSQADVHPQGWAIEARINAEDPSKNFLPSAGRITNLRFPGGAGVRVDSAMFSGAQIPPYYDSMVAKIIAWDHTRERAVARLMRAVHELEIAGVKTNREFVLKLLSSREFLEGHYSIDWVEKSLLAQGETS